MNYFPGYPVRRPKKKEAADSSGTEGTQRSSMYDGSGITPTFHNVSDDQIFDTPRGPKHRKGQASTQDFMQQLVNQNQNGMSSNGLFGSYFSFGERNEGSSANDIFGMSSDSNPFDHFQFNYAGEDFFSFQEEMEDRNDEKQENLSFHDKVQAGEKRSVLNPTKKQSRIQDFEKVNGMTIFEVKEEFQGLTNPMYASQQTSQNVTQTNFQPQSQNFQSNKKSEADNERLRQSIIEVLSSMNSSESASRKQIMRDSSFGIKEKVSDQEDKDTIIDDLSDLVLSPPKDEKQTKIEKILTRPLAGSQRKGQIEVYSSEVNHGNSTKTHFELRNKSKPIQPQLQNEVSEPINYNAKKQSFFKRYQNQDNFNGQERSRQLNQEILSDRSLSQIIESKVAQIQLENLQSFGAEENLIKDHQKIKKPEESKSFFKNKPYDVITERNERKNNLMKKQSLEKPKEIPNKNEKSSRKSLFQKLNSNRAIKPNEINENFGQYLSNPLPFDDQHSQNQSYPTKPFEYHSQTIDPFSQFDTKPINYQKSELSVSKFGMFGKRNRHIDQKKPQDVIKVLKKQVTIEEKNPTILIRNKSEERKMQPDLKKNEKITTQSHQNDDKVGIRSTKFNFMRPNSERIVQISKIQVKQQQKQINITDQQNKADKKPFQRGMFKFERKKNRESKASKNSLSSMNSQTSENGLDMKGIFEKVNEKKQINRKNILKENPNQDQKPKFAFSFKNRNPVQNLKSSNLEDEKKDVVISQKQVKKVQNGTNQQRKFRFGSYLRNDQRSKEKDFSERKVEVKGENIVDRTMTVEKEKPRMNSTIPKYIFSKKTPPKNPSIFDEKVEKKETLMFENLRQSEANLEGEQKPQQQNAFQSRTKPPRNQHGRSNYIIQLQQQGYRPPTESQKRRYREKRTDSTDFPSLSSNSTRSELIKEVEGLIELVAVAKIKMRRKKQESEEFLQKTIDLKKRVDELFPDERIKKLMEWKYL